MRSEAVVLDAALDGTDAAAIGPGDGGTAVVAPGCPDPGGAVPGAADPDEVRPDRPTSSGFEHACTHLRRRHRAPGAARH
jgi:hypothetical protein